MKGKCGSEEKEEDFAAGIEKVRKGMRDGR